MRDVRQSIIIAFPRLASSAGSGFRLYLFCIGQLQTPPANSNKQTSRHQPQKRMSAQSRE
ncbi:MAG: hypothetical protein LBQ31_06230 [Bacteroidales bacterium]|nr:hypothetical protein [Bacteroidales bacterium]